MMEIVKLIFVGIVIGMANVIPGVSGGTLVVVFNLYDKFVNAITLNVKKLWGNRKFLIPLIGGMLLGILIFSKLVTILYSKFPVQTNFCFTGLIIGCIPLLANYAWANKADEKGETKKRSPLFHVSLVVCILVGLALIIAFTILEGKFSPEGVVDGVLPAFTWPLAFKIFIAGVLGAIVMIVPGISGSLIMLIMGVYTIIMASIPALFNPSTFFQALILLLPNGIGVLAGLIGGAKLIQWLLKKCPNHAYAVILGLLVGSIYAIFPGFSALNSVGRTIGCVVCLLAGCALAYFSNKLDFSKDGKN
ncbi:MAG: DUF368 domain-containing protein [Treponema sp.]|nr:DUF368 domain-containing protein [Treponema sp.]